MKTAEQNAEKLIEFVNFLNDFSCVLRDKYKSENLQENDAEHSYKVTMASWYLNQKLKLNLNNEKILKYGLTHDLPETFAGDVSSYEKSRNENVEKDQNLREQRAAERILSEFDDFPELGNIIISYEEQENSESKLVRAVDKMITQIDVNYYKFDRFFHRNNVSFDEMYAERVSRGIGAVPKIREIFDVLVEKFKKDGMFPS